MMKQKLELRANYQEFLLSTLLPLEKLPLKRRTMKQLGKNEKHLEKQMW